MSTYRKVVTVEVEAASDREADDLCAEVCVSSRRTFANITAMHLAAESPRRYAVAATYLYTTEDGYSCGKPLPTFYLDARTQGIHSVSQARAIARDILDPFTGWVSNLVLYVEEV